MLNLNFHLRFSYDDKDILAWIHGIPPNSFNKFVCFMIKAESKRKVADIPVPEVLEEVVCRKGEWRLYTTDDDVISYISSIPKGKRTRQIKRIIRKNIDAAYKRAERNRISQKAERTEIVSSEQQVTIDNSNEEYNAYRERMKKICGN